MANNSSSVILREIANQERINLLSKNLPLPPDTILQEYSVDTSVFVRDNDLNNHIPEYIQNNYKQGSEVLNSNGSNKYTPENPYNLENDKLSKVFDVINGISDVYRGNSIIGNIGTGDFQTNSKLQNSVIGRILNNPNETELGKIGLQNLVILFAKRTSQEYLQGLVPSIDIRDESGRISLKPNDWSISAPYVSDVRGFRYYYIGSPIQEPRVIGRDHSLPPNTVGGQVNFKGIDLDDEGFGRLVYTNTNLILSKNDKDSQITPGTALQWENQQSLKDNPIENAFRGTNPYKRGLLRFTQQLINDGHSDGTDKYHPGKIITMPFKEGDSATDPSKGAIPRGTRVGVNYSSDGTENGTYCRNWTKNRRYDNVDSLVRGSNSTFIKGNFLEKPNGSFSVLQDNGFIRVGYDKKDISIKDFMFSIENLGWEGLTDDLPELERGKNRGRLMWFPPYNLEFSEQNSANWETTQILGRVEPIYTYNNSERTGTLSFTVLSDYPAIMDSDDFKDLSYEEFQKFFWGCEPNFPDIPNFDKEQDLIVSGSKIINKIPIGEISAFFENDITTINSSWSGWAVAYPGGYSDFEDKINEIKNELSQYPDNEIIITIVGSASKRCIQGNNIPNCQEYNNDTLPNARAKEFENFLKNELGNNQIFFKYIIGKPLPATIGDNNPGGENTDKEIKSRFAKATILVGDSVSNSSVLKYVKKTGKYQRVDLDERNERTFEKIESDFIFEDEIEFETLKKDAIMNAMFRDRMKEKIRHFHPSFHSTTPQGLNRRLTFLTQCTRPGKTISKERFEDGVKKVLNTTFSTPPICILRLGDFYNTKIVIDSVNIDYEKMWDLNPEGIGVQPMIANVTINFKFIGGSSMSGPVSRLQNALQHNFFANTELYQKFEKDNQKYIKYSESEQNMYNKSINIDTIGFNKPITLKDSDLLSTKFSSPLGPTIAADPPTLLMSGKQLDDFIDDE